MVVNIIKPFILTRSAAVDTAYKEDLADFLESLARSLRSGAGTKDGIIETTDAFLKMNLDEGFTADLKAFKDRLGQGVLLNQALEEWAAPRPEVARPEVARPEVVRMKAVLTFGADFGGQRARAVEALAGSFRREISIEEELYALTTQARTSAMVIALLPVGFFFVFALLDSDFLGFLFTTPLGLVCLFLGLGLDAIGTWWMKRILDRCS